MARRSSDRIVSARLRVAVALSGARAAAGVALLIAPGASLRLAGLGGRELDREGRFLLRGFAVREISLGAAVLAECARGEPSPSLLAINAATDLADAIGAAVLWRGSRPLRRTALLGASSGAAAAITWAWLRGGLGKAGP